MYVTTSISVTLPFYKGNLGWWVTPITSSYFITLWRILTLSHTLWYHTNYSGVCHYRSNFCTRNITAVDRKVDSCGKFMQWVLDGYLLDKEASNNGQTDTEFQKNLAQYVYSPETSPLCTFYKLVHTYWYILIPICRIHVKIVDYILCVSVGWGKRKLLFLFLFIKFMLKCIFMVETCHNYELGQFECLKSQWIETIRMV